jgi:hypothetical protein
MAVKYNFELNNNITLLSSKQFEQILSSDHYIKNGNNTNQEVYDIKSNKLRAIYNEFTIVELDTDYRKISDHIESYINNPYRSTDIYNELWAFEDRGFELLRVPKNTQIYKSPAIYEPGQINKPISYFSNAKTAAMYWKKYAGAFINYNINQDIILFVNSDANLRIILNDDNTPQTVKDAINMLYIVTEKTNIVESTKYYNKNVAYIHYLYKIVFEDLNISITDYDCLLQNNITLWRIEDDIRLKEKDKEFDNNFVKLARSVYITNDIRFEIKNHINLKYNSNFREEKSYEKY